MERRDSFIIRRAPIFLSILVLFATYGDGCDNDLTGNWNISTPTAYFQRISGIDKKADTAYTGVLTVELDIDKQGGCVAVSLKQPQVRYCFYGNYKNYKVEIEKLQKEDKRKYVVRNNSSGNISSGEVNDDGSDLSFKLGSDEFKGKSPGFDGMDGNNVILRCTSPDGNPLELTGVWAGKRD